MRPMARQFDIKNIVAFILLTLAVGHGKPAGAEELTPAAAAQVDASAERFISGGSAPGASVAIVRSGQLIYSKGYGLENIELGSPATSATVFRVGSITKMFTAAAIMRLAQDGRIHLDDSVSKYVPELPSKPTLTIRMLLEQTSGLRDYGETLEDICDSHTTKQLVDYIAAQVPLTEFTPGSKWAYSNSNYFILGAIVERVSDQPLGSYLAANVIAPAHLQTTAFDDTAQIVPHRASGYSPVKTQTGHFLNAACLAPENAGGAGALRSTAADLARWQQALFSDKIITRASVEDMITPGRLSNGEMAIRPDAPISAGRPGYGFGLEIGALDAEKAIAHGGSVPGFTGYLVTFPNRQLTIAIMTNGMPRRPQDIQIFYSIERAALKDATK